MPEWDVFKQRRGVKAREERLLDAPMNLKEAASYLGLTPDTLGRLVDRGEAQALRARSKWSDEPSAVSYTFTRRGLDEFIESCRIQPGTIPSGRPYR